MSAPPTSAMQLLCDGHPVAKVCQWTGVSRWHLQLAIHANGMYIDRDTDTAHVIPVEQTGPPWRIWGRSNGWPDLDDAGPLPPGLMVAYEAAVKSDREAIRRAEYRGRRSA